MQGGGQLDCDPTSSTSDGIFGIATKIARGLKGQDRQEIP